MKDPKAKEQWTTALHTACLQAASSRVAPPIARTSLVKNGPYVTMIQGPKCSAWCAQYCLFRPVNNTSSSSYDSYNVVKVLGQTKLISWHLTSITLISVHFTMSRVSRTTFSANSFTIFILKNKCQTITRNTWMHNLIMYNFVKSIRKERHIYHEKIDSLS